jgi:soluble lytic murein transglycosylase
MDLVHLERGLIALALGEPQRAVPLLQPLVALHPGVAKAAALPLAQAQAQVAPQQFLDELPKLLDLFAAGQGTKGPDGEARSQLWACAAQAHEALHDAAGALQARRQRYLTEPNAPSTPQEPPPGAQIEPAQAMERIETLVAAHNSSAGRQGIAAFDAAYPSSLLAADVRCRRHFALGLASRKLHRYAEAEDNLRFVRERCTDGDLVRRAAFLEAKVVSIQDGLRALPLIEQFVSRYPGHSMTDDVLFWAGDSHQRRGHKVEAESYYERILKLPVPDDQCEDAAWRLAWLAYVDNKLPLARRRLAMALASRCPSSADGVARAHYWTGRIDEASGQPGQAITAYRKAIRARPMGYYAQQAAQRLLPLLPPNQRRQQRLDLRAPAPLAPEGLCPLQLVQQPPFLKGLYALRLGLMTDARAAFAAVQAPTLPKALGTLHRCGPAQSALLLAQLRLAAGDGKGSLEEVLRHFASVLLSPVQPPGAGSVWRAAYPEAYRPILAAAEQEEKVPAWLLQALAREESRFDAEVVSWAEAYGLTQLTLAAAQTAGRYLTPHVAPTAFEELFDPSLNARLGGALLGQLGQRYGGFWPLALAGYNGGQRLGDAWWQRFGGQEFARVTEEIPVKETRTYVQRVMETFAIYRWLYAGEPPGTALPASVPPYRPKKARL